MIIFTLFLGILLSVSTFLLGFTCGKFKGAKDGIDYCFEQRERKRVKEITELNKK
jgi:hypothetical protein